MGSIILTPSVAPAIFRSKIVFPAQVSPPPAPALSQVAGGSFLSGTFYVVITFVLQDQTGALHESLPSNESGFAISANNLLQVASPSQPITPLAVVGYNVYVATASMGYGQGTYGSGFPYGSGTGGGVGLQNTSPIPIGTSWTEPTTGLLGSVPPPTSWGNTLIFQWPGKGFPYVNWERKGHDDFSTGGLEQSITWYLDRILDFEVPYIAAGEDAGAWQEFLNVALYRVPFDFYKDSTKPAYATLILTDDTSKLAYKAPGLYSIAIRARYAILQ